MSETGIKVEVDDFEIYYEKHGNGDHHLLLLPGLLATPEIDFPHQLAGLDKSKLSLYAIHPPGYGNSRPPFVKNFKNYYLNDSQLYKKFMEKIGVEKYSVLGYSDGGRPACWMTNKNASVEKLILVSTSAYALDRFKQTYARFRDLKLWPEEKRRVFENIYGFDGLSKNFSNYLNEMMRMQYFIPPEVLKGIKCPTMILQGQRDLIINPEHAVYIQKRINSAKLWMFDADHNILKDKSVEVNRKIHEFLLNDN